MRGTGGAASGLEVNAVLSRGDFHLDLQLAVQPGEVVALLGPNGSGKTSTLHLVAGLVPLNAGQIRIGGAVVDDPRVGTFTAAERRSASLVFQDYLLFPHLSATENVAFGLRATGVAREGARTRAREWLHRIGVGEFADVRPGRLSGGQQQRVALARALVTEPQVLLLDEPMAALDAGTRIETRSHLSRHLRDYAGCVLLVTHDPIDAMALADRIVVLDAGQVVQAGTPAEVARAPRTEYVARLVGLNLHRGNASGEQVQLDDGGWVHLAEQASGPVLVTVSPTAVSLHRHRPEGSPRNVWRSRVAAVEQQAHTVRVTAAEPGTPMLFADVTPGAVADLDLELGAEIWVSFKATETHAYPA